MTSLSQQATMLKQITQQRFAYHLLVCVISYHCTLNKAQCRCNKRVIPGERGPWLVVSHPMSQDKLPNMLVKASFATGMSARLCETSLKLCHQQFSLRRWHLLVCSDYLEKWCLSLPAVLPMLLQTILQLTHQNWILRSTQHHRSLFPKGTPCG